MRFPIFTQNNRVVDIRELNEKIENSPKELIEQAEIEYRRQLIEIADEIYERRENCQILFVAGPSGSTKTTTAQKLSKWLLKKGIHSIVLSMDDFFLNREDLPRLPNGDMDFETIDTLDKPKLKECLTELLETHQSEFPIFDFSKGRRSDKTRRVAVDSNSIVVIEGIHALNPMVVQGFDKDSYVRIYVSPDCDYVMDGKLVLSSRNTRLLRRIVRDFYHRGNTAFQTMEMWVNVVKSEIQNIMPFKDTADFTIDTSVIYEPSVFDQCLEEIVTEADVNSRHGEKLDELNKALDCFSRIDRELVPKNSVLREFMAD